MKKGQTGRQTQGKKEQNEKATVNFIIEKNAHFIHHYLTIIFFRSLDNWYDF